MPLRDQKIVQANTSSSWSRHVELAAAYQLSCFIKMFFKKFKICQIFISSFLLNISYTALLLSDVPCSPK